MNILNFVNKFFSLLTQGNLFSTIFKRIGYYSSKTHLLISIKSNENEVVKQLFSQFHQSYHRKDYKLPERARRLIHKIKDYSNFDYGNVLCVGCRNINEINLFKEIGYKNVIGIDLFSGNKEIQIMDMHNLRYKDSTFDVIYCSHVIEHSYEPKTAVAEMLRTVNPKGIIAIEFPINFKTGGVDIWDFKSLDNFLKIFPRNSVDVLWFEVSQAGQYECYTDAIRMILTLREISSKN